MNELFYTSATELARRIREGELSACEVTITHLERIAQVNPHLNAVVQLEAEKALAAARAADKALARGETVGPLHGVPFTVKDWIEVAGVICAAGTESRRAYVPQADATVVARLRQAGGIFLGKTNVTISNPVYGRTNNPYNIDYSPAGSSSGEAAIIAAGGSPLGLGSDSGGSIRQPAHNCGIAGLKPTSGRVPLTGHYPYISPLNDPRTVIGPLARTVADLALVLPLIAGADWRDASTIPMPLQDWQQVELAGLRVVFYTYHEEAEPSPETVTVVRKVAQALADAGLQVTETLPPRINEAYAITRDYWRRPESTSLDEWSPDSTPVLDSLAVEKHLFEWDRFRREMIGFMQEVDLILNPVAELPAQPHDAYDGRIPYTLPYSLTGYPAVVVRAGTAPDGMPIGVQLVARPWREDVALAVAQWLETTFGGWRPPQLDK